MDFLGWQQCASVRMKGCNKKVVFLQMSAADAENATKRGADEEKARRGLTRGASLNKHFSCIRFSCCQVDTQKHLFSLCFCFFVLLHFNLSVTRSRKLSGSWRSLDKPTRRFSQPRIRNWKSQRFSMPSFRVESEGLFLYKRLILLIFELMDVL